MAANMTIWLKLTKTQRDFLELLAAGNVARETSINGRNFSFETLDLLRRRKLIEQHYSPGSSFEAPREFAITSKGREYLAGKLIPSVNITKRQKEILAECALGNEITLQNRDGIHFYYQADKTVDTLSISLLYKQGYLIKLYPDKDTRVLGTGYTISPKGISVIDQSAS